MAKQLLVAIDVQNDFLKGGVLPYGYPKEDNLKKIMDYIHNFRLRGFEGPSKDYYLLATKDTHSADYHNSREGHFLPEHCIKGTRGHDTACFFTTSAWKAQRLEEVADKVILKKTFGTFEIVKWVEEFEKTECEEIDEIQLIGYDLAICVLANAVILRAAFPNKKIAVLKDLCGCVSKETFDAAIKVLECQQIEVF